MNGLSKRLSAAVAAGSVMLAAAAPAAAQDRWRDYEHERARNSISAGEIIAGAVVLGGLAAVISAASRDRYDRRYDDRYGYRFDNPRQAVEQCVRAAQIDARRAGYRYAEVTHINNVNRTRRGLEVNGRLRVEDTRGYGYGHGRDDWRGSDRRGFSDNGRFTCLVDGGRVRGINYRSIRGLS
ncbi:hypothetical protein EYB45_08255 [Erythrobacteraceae bacterium CFH 75059]|uniref:hypothetical protein n=1 Tax=Qipengyuania thermophila TaxID=2509361 RepID=UPI00102040A0|nr:hypothetical protein [Qipengyuania thermophila]TCD05450.1 hypothetical protein EYB45_08255 [Erythrobacteraceae bacterium CFH 75059]